MSMKAVDPKEAWPEIPSEKCPECHNLGRLIDISVYSRRSGKPAVEHYECEDCGIEFGFSTP